MERRGGHHVSRAEELAAKAAARRALRANSAPGETVILEGDGRSVEAKPYKAELPGMPKEANDETYDDAAKSKVQVEPTVMLTAEEYEARMAARRAAETVEVPALIETVIAPAVEAPDRLDEPTIVHLHAIPPEDMRTRPPAEALMLMPDEEGAVEDYDEREEEKTVLMEPLDVLPDSAIAPLDAVQEDGQQDAGELSLDEGTLETVHILHPEMSDNVITLDQDPNARVEASLERLQDERVQERIKDVQLRDGTVVGVHTEMVPSVFEFYKGLKPGATLEGIGFQFETTGETQNDLPEGPEVYQQVSGSTVTILKSLGDEKGAFGEVYLASSQGPDGPEDLIVKVHQVPGGSRDELEVATKEAVASYGKLGDLMRGVKRYEDAEGDGLMITVMNKAEGTVGRELRKTPEALQGAEGVERMGTAGVSLLEQLMDLHAQGIAHRDIKPGNLFVTETGAGSTLIDFGLAEQLFTEDLGVVSDSKNVMGTPRYMLPDMFHGGAHQAMNGDVYAVMLSMGVMMGLIQPGKSKSLLDRMHKLMDGSYFTAPNLDTPEQRKAFIETHGSGAKLLLYDLIYQVVRPADTIRERHQAWVNADVLYRDDEELFEDKAYVPIDDTQVDAKVTYRGAAITEDIRRAWPQQRVYKKQLLNIARIKHELEMVAHLARQEQSGQTAVIEPQVQEHWIETGSWEYPAAA